MQQSNSVILNYDMVNRLDAVNGASAQLISACEPLAWLDLDTLELAVTEALNNAVIHGSDPDQTDHIYVQAKIRASDVTIRIRDPLGALDASMLSPERAVADDAHSGRGLNIIQALAQNVEIVDGALVITFSNTV